MEETEPLIPPGTPVLTLEEAQKEVASKAAPRVTKEGIEKKISRISYIPFGTLTICIIVMENGFMVVGKAAPASPANYDPEIGQRYAYEDAFKQLWHLEGYALCDRLAGFDPLK